MKQGAKWIGGALLAVILLWLVLRGKDPAAVWAAIGRASLPGLFLAAAVNLSHNFFRVIRWGLLLKPVRAHIGFRNRMSAVIIGYLTTWVFPGRLGELVRPALLSSRENLPLGPCLGSVVADRLLDGVAIVVLFAVGTFLSPLDIGGSDQAAAIRASSIVLVLVITLLLGFLLVAGAARARISAWLDARSSAALRWTGRTVLAVAQGTEALKRPRLLVPILFYSMLAWGTIAAGTWIGVRASGADVPLSAIFVLLPPLALGVALPTPGGAGGYHAAMTLGLVRLFGVPEAEAVSAGILMHLAVTLPVILVGLVFLWSDGVSLGDLKSVAGQMRSLGAAPIPGDGSREAAR